MQNKNIRIFNWQIQPCRLHLTFRKYFLNRLRYRLKKATARNYKIVYLEDKELDDLSLWTKLLFQAATKGIDINHVTFTEPSIICYSDACEHGIGGYIINGAAWRFELPPHLIGMFSINLLEFIASFLTIEFSLSYKTKHNYPHRILCFTDSSSALGWLFKANFNTVTHPLHDRVARELAWFCTKNNVSLFGQHIPGKNNIIADSL